MKRIALLLLLCVSAFAQRQSPFWTIIGRGTVAPSTCSGNVIFIISTDGSYRYCNGSSFINPFLGISGIGSLNTLTDATQVFAKTNDTNVTLTITSSSPTHTFALGWTGTLAAGRLNSNVVQGITSDTNVTGSISTQNLTLGWTGTLAAGRLNGNVVQGITNDTNVTGSISAQNLTIGWTGTLAKARQNSATVYNDAANTWSTGLQDLGAATLKIPSGAGFTAASSSMLGYDSTNKNFHGYLNAADAIIPGFASAPTNGHCLQASVASGNVLLSDAGAACGNVTATSLTTNRIPKASGPTAAIDSSITDDGTTVSTTEPIKAPSISTGSTPPASSVCTPGTAGMFCMLEGTPATGTLLGVGNIWFDTSHLTHINNNNVDSYAMQTAATDTTATHAVFATATAGKYASRAIGTGDLPAIPLAGLATQAADTVVMNATAGSAAPTAVAMPTGGTNGCSGTGDKLVYNNSTHSLGCGADQTGGAVTVTFFAESYTDHFSGNAQAVTANQLRCTGYYAPYNIQTGNVAIGIDVNDLAGGLYDFSIYSSSGALIANIGPATYTVATVVDLPWAQGTVTIPQGNYYRCVTGNSNVVNYDFGSRFYGYASYFNAGATTGGASLSSFTPPAASWANSALGIAMVFH